MRFSYGLPLLESEEFSTHKQHRVRMYFINDPTAGGGLVEEKRKENAAISDWDFSFFYVLSPSLTLCRGGKNDIYNCANNVVCRYLCTNVSCFFSISSGNVSLNCSIEKSLVVGIRY